ncbi:MAG: hypothetical protein IPP33_15890 [Flavobacteriales bacterium]|nr:hypothetical protein [Flavobacteriales bacterium]
MNDRATHEDKLQAQVKKAKELKGIGDLDALLAEGEHTTTIDHRSQYFSSPFHAIAVQLRNMHRTWHAIDG